MKWLVPEPKEPERNAPRLMNGRRHPVVADAVGEAQHVVFGAGVLGDVDDVAQQRAARFTLSHRSLLSHARPRASRLPSSRQPPVRVWIFCGLSHPFDDARLAKPLEPPDGRRAGDTKHFSDFAGTQLASVT